MIVRGRVEKGVVVLEQNGHLPEGTPVTVYISESDAVADRMPESERHRILAIMDRIAGLPLEGKGSFSGADHDKVLYGRP